jgi:hypothetical protein
MATCDVDGSDYGVESVTISWRGESFVVDLCVDELAVIEKWKAAGSTSPRKRQSERAKPPVHRVVPIA